LCHFSKLHFPNSIQFEVPIFKRMAKTGQYHLTDCDCWDCSKCWTVWHWAEPDNRRERLIFVCVNRGVFSMKPELNFILFI
jgi:hypothetical protein